MCKPCDSIKIYSQDCDIKYWALKIRYIYGQPLAYGYSVQVHTSKNFPKSCLVLSFHPFAPITFDGPTAFPTDTSATKCRSELKARLLHCAAIMPKEVDNQMRLSQHWYKDSHDRNRHNSSLSFTVRQYNNYDWPPINTSVAERLATKFYNKQMSPVVQDRVKESKCHRRLLRSMKM